MTAPLTLAGDRCSATGCTNPATLQWQRQATADEAAAHVAALTATQTELVQQRRDTLAMEVESLTHQLGRVKEKGGQPRLERAVAEQIVRVQALHDAVKDPPPMPVDEVLFAVQACDTHKVDLEHAAVTHEADCRAGACGCPTPDVLKPTTPAAVEPAAAPQPAATG